ncbi:UDP-glucose 4-epimerase GalE [Streptomyces sp. 135]|uniref:UDP-glucose 4-epimerase GalE n=1 Tax=Streptomyces sp. 135 TaxID=2838850 RepID=UPI001CBB8895|nr:UDP-glucose 4-epimerase GalE [Streptomyces sp. 135]
MKVWLIAGGAGYIGGHVVKSMHDAGEGVIVVDDLSTGSRDNVPEGVPFVQESILNGEALRKVFQEYEVEGVINMVARTQVGESFTRPLDYYQQNVEGFRVLLAAMRQAGVRNLIYSSSASVYGAPDVDLVTEDLPCHPMSPYGQSKLIGEWLGEAAHTAFDMSVVNLRYFNVAGAVTPAMADKRVLNLVPMVFEKLTHGRAPVIFGGDYDTPDGTCIRDFIHVADIASAHLAAARHLRAHDDAVLRTYNVGRGEGVSVRALISMICEVSGLSIPPVVADRRPGDPVKVVADARPIQRDLGWKAQHSVFDMVASAWEGWCAQHPQARAVQRQV